MKISAKKLYREATETLRAAGIENAAAEARWLAERFFCCSAAELAADFEIENPSEFLGAVKKRAAGEPLQYIIGTQGFMGLDIKVGKGVLIPRPETELLVRIGAQAVPEAKIVWDLCAGSGCVGLGLRTLLPKAQVVFVEKYSSAMKVLSDNIGDLKNCTIYRADLLKNRLTKLPDPDLILSNPPYIPQRDIPKLQREVLKEPRTALDGGTDGLMFYHALAQLAKKRLKKSGALCAEFGFGQADAVRRIFSNFDIKIDRDERGIERVITAKLTNS